MGGSVPHVEGGGPWKALERRVQRLPEGGDDGDSNNKTLIKQIFVHPDLLVEKPLELVRILDII